MIEGLEICANKKGDKTNEQVENTSPSPVSLPKFSSFDLNEEADNEEEEEEDGVADDIKKKNSADISSSGEGKYFFYQLVKKKFSKINSIEGTSREKKN